MGLLNRLNVPYCGLFGYYLIYFSFVIDFPVCLSNLERFWTFLAVVSVYQVCQLNLQLSFCLAFYL